MIRWVPKPPQLPQARRRGWTRRQVLRWGVVGGTAALLPVSLPGCGDDGEVAGPLPPEPSPSPAPSFLTERERAILERVVDHLVPADADGPGALQCGAHRYIDRLLSWLPDAADPGGVFAGGPFSGRNPFPDFDRGRPSDRFPPNDFARFVPLNRLQRLSWRARILGSAAVPEFDFNRDSLGELLGLRTQVRLGLTEIEDLSQSMFGRSSTELDATQLDRVLEQTDPDFVSLLSGLVFEGMFSVPEYGGNHDLQGWQLIGYDGDSQPLGYSLFDRAADTYRERPDKPNSGPNPGESFSPFPFEIASLLRLLTRLAGSPRFP